MIARVPGTAVCTLLLTIALGVPAWAAPDFSGVWESESSPAALHTLKGSLPPLTPKARKLYEAHLAARRSGDLAFDTTASCQPPGLPRAYFMGMPFEIQQEQRDVFVLFQWNRLFRVVDLDIDHQQQNQYAPTFFGWSVGHFDGDTLLIDSVLFNDTTLLDAAGLPHGMNLHIVENWKLSADRQQIRDRITIEDPSAYLHPWSFDARFRRLPAGVEIAEDVCLERLHLIGQSGKP